MKSGKSGKSRGILFFPQKDREKSGNLDISQGKVRKNVDGESGKTGKKSGKSQGILCLKFGRHSVSGKVGFDLPNNGPNLHYLLCFCSLQSLDVKSY